MPKVKTNMSNSGKKIRPALSPEARGKSSNISYDRFDRTVVDR